MKFILFNINDTNKNIIRKIELDNTNYINEVSLSKDILENMNVEPKKLMAKIKYHFCNKNIEKTIIKALDGHMQKWYYIMSNNMLNNKYLYNKIQSLLGYKLTCTNELDNNIFKYVDMYLKDNNSLKKHEIKVLLVATANKNLNFTLINNLIKEYKTINIYLREKPSSYTLKKIKQINKDEGTTIDIVKAERKAFPEYNVVYFVDDKRANYPRLRLNKDALVIDIDHEDKFNSNIIFMKEYISKEETFKSNIESLMKTYELLELSSIIRKIVNELDKL